MKTGSGASEAKVDELIARKDRLVTIHDTLKKHDLLNEVLAICKRHYVSFEEAFSDSRDKSRSRARHEAWGWLHEKTRWSYSRLAELFGRDHTTVMYGVKQWNRKKGEA